MSSLMAIRSFTSPSYTSWSSSVTASAMPGSAPGLIPHLSSSPDGTKPPVGDAKAETSSAVARKLIMVILPRWPHGVHRPWRRRTASNMGVG